MRMCPDVLERLGFVSSRRAPQRTIAVLQQTPVDAALLDIPHARVTGSRCSIRPGTTPS